MNSMSNSTVLLLTSVPIPPSQHLAVIIAASKAREPLHHGLQNEPLDRRTVYNSPLTSRFKPSLTAVSTTTTRPYLFLL